MSNNEANAPGSRPPRQARGGRGGREPREGREGREGRGRRDSHESRDSRDRGGEGDVELIDKLVHINRVAKVVKGGRRFSFAALVVVGDGKGRVGFGTGKAREVPEAIRKATDRAKRAMVRIPLREGRTLHHDVQGRYGAGKVVVRAAPAGTGIIAGGPMRAVFETMGVQDVVAKSIGSANAHNMIRATFDALGNCMSPRTVATRRGKKVGEIVSRRGGGAAAQAAAAKE
ncbi:MAG: 30S ribosomal protein S5 [Magnetospirillum sp. WYHS-4]